VAQITVLGGGQLGWMLGLAGIPLGLSFRFLDPSADAPAQAVGDLVVAELDDEAAAAKAADGSAVVTYEWEGVPATTAYEAGRTVPIHPAPRALEMSQDRFLEKATFNALGIATAPFSSVGDRASLDDAIAQVGLPAVLKTRRGGYDGKGQAVLRARPDADSAFAELGGVPLILEGFIPFRRELSIVAVRAPDGTTLCWPVVENTHELGILRLTRAPAPGVDDAVQTRAEACIRPLLDLLGYVGVCCVELFDLDGELLANEMAPRVHNSGHWTIEGAHTSQFENHLRAVLGWPLGSTEARGASAMVNCIGRMPDRDAVLSVPGAHLHDYRKRPRRGRKLGHVTVCAADADTLEPALARVLELVRASADG
jgi:5-(carboxyamino)imidazole ribonucleotide synthase